DRVHHPRQRADGGWRAIKLAAAVVGYADRVGAGGHRDLGVIDVEDAFEDQLARPQAFDPFDVLPRQRRIELARRSGRQRIDVLHAFHVAGEVAEGLALAAQDGECPRRLGGDVDDVLELEFRRYGQAVA